jgi:hypothetical protein
MEKYTHNKFQDGGTQENLQSQVAVWFRIEYKSVTCSVSLQYKRLCLAVFSLKSKDKIQVLKVKKGKVKFSPLQALKGLRVVRGWDSHIF